MTSIKVVRHTVEANSKDLNQFALSTLSLVNYKSSRADTIIDIKTLEGTNIIVIDSYEDITNDLENMFPNSSIETEKVNLVLIGLDDLKAPIMSKIEKLDGEEDDLIIQFSDDI